MGFDLSNWKLKTWTWPEDAPEDSRVTFTYRPLTEGHLMVIVEHDLTKSKSYQDLKEEVGADPGASEESAQPAALVYVDKRKDWLKKDSALWTRLMTDCLTSVEGLLVNGKKASLKEAIKAMVTAEVPARDLVTHLYKEATVTVEEGKS